MTVKSEPKKRGRKAKKTADNTTPTVPKKRGRNLKEGKLLKIVKLLLKNLHKNLMSYYI